jgi:hypothetical protein
MSLGATKVTLSADDGVAGAGVDAISYQVTALSTKAPQTVAPKLSLDTTLTYTGAIDLSDTGSQLVPGTYRLTYWASDKAIDGSTGSPKPNVSTPASFTFTVADVTAPKVALTASKTHLVLAADDGDVGSGRDVIKYIIYKNDSASLTTAGITLGEVYTYTDPIDITPAGSGLAGGKYTISYWAVDKAGNESAHERYDFSVEATPKQPSLVEDDNNPPAPLPAQNTTKPKKPVAPEDLDITKKTGDATAASTIIIAALLATLLMTGVLRKKESVASS